MFLDLFISDGNDLGWALIVILPIGMLVLLGWLIWGVFTPPKLKPAGYVEASKWTWMTLAWLFLVVMWCSR
jgi:hypothetical protein